MRGIDYKFTASIKNIGNKTITNVHWSYCLVPKDSQEGFAYVFTTKVSIPPGKEKTLREQVSSVVIPADKDKAPAINNRAQFNERVVILRLDYADGSSWKSSGSR